MPKVLGQAGISLADQYDVEGSIAGVDELVSRDVVLLHEMGGTMLSERLGAFVLLSATAAIAQSLNFEVDSAALPDCPNRILGVQVAINATARVNEACVVISGSSGREYPIFIWDDANDVEAEARFAAGGAAGNKIILMPSLPFVPTLAVRSEDDKTMPTITLRGTTTAFGAGTVIIEAFVYLCRANTETPAAGDPSSHGLPLPSW